jgi:hypothetical protein
MCALFLAATLAACGSSSSSNDAGAHDASATTDGGVDCTTKYNGGGTNCAMNPMTHLEIINACTTAQKIEKHPVLPMLNADCSLPPIQ